MDIPNINTVSVMSWLEKLTAKAEIMRLIRENIEDNVGREVCVYSYLKDIIKIEQGDEIETVRSRTYKRKIIDMVLTFKKGYTIGIEIKGPSKDGAYISKGLKKDTDKLRSLLGKHLNKGFAVAIFLERVGSQASKAVSKFNDPQQLVEPENYRVKFGVNEIARQYRKKNVVAE